MPPATPSRRARLASPLRLWLLIAVAFAVAKAAVDQINFQQLVLSFTALGEVLFVAAGQTLVYRLIARRR